ncbi:MAG: methyltransferase domain-containing protein, partial [Nitrospinaceae bacterium]
MKIQELGIYQCPECRRTGLQLKEAQWDQAHKEILEGRLVCDGCPASFPVLKGIPRFVPSRNYSQSFGYQWNLHRRTQLDSYTGFPLSRNRLKEGTGWPEKMEGQRILEAGSGAGRFTEILLDSKALVFSFDFSRAVEANWQNNGAAPNLSLFQGDMSCLPFRPGIFDKVFCFGVLQHTPDPEAAFKSLASQVRPGGELVIDVYKKTIAALLHWKYILRPLTKRVDLQTLYRVVAKWVPRLLPVAIVLRKIGGRAGARLLPVLQYSHWGLPYALNKEWAILDTFDMLSP